MLGKLASISLMLKFGFVLTMYPLSQGMSAVGRKRTLVLTVLEHFERPLSPKADLELILTKEAANDPKRAFTVGPDGGDTA